jgi:hypothetical protein
MQNAREIGARHSHNVERPSSSLSSPTILPKKQDLANASLLRATFSFFASRRYNQISEWDRKPLQWSQNRMSTPIA